MPQPTVLRTPLVSILAAVEARLVAASVVPTGLVKWWAGKGRAFPAKLDSGIDVVLWVRGFTAPPIETGRFSVRLTRRLDVVPRTRLLLDEMDRLKIWLSGAGGEAGYFPTEEAVIDALHLWAPLDASGNDLAACPLHLLTGQDPEPETEGWGYGGVSFELQYRSPVNQAVI